MEKRTVKSHIFNYIALFAGLTALGYLLLVAAYALPIGRMKLGAANSIHIFQTEELAKTEGGDVLESLDYYNTALDHYMDGEAINMAICNDGTSPFLQAVTVNKYLYDDMNPKDSLIHYIWEEEGYYIESYARFWHGYLIVIKPLLLFFSLADIRMINMFVQVCLMFALVWLMTAKGLGCLVPALAISYFFLTPSVLYKSIQYSTVFYVAILAAILLLAFYDSLKERGLLGEFFFALGIITNYIILLTFPLFSLGIPLGLLICIMVKEREATGTVTGRTLCYSIAWGAGYGLMWGIKWLISYLVMGPSAFEAVIDTFRIRAIGGEGAEDYTILSMILGNIGRFERPIYKIILIAATLIYIIAYVIVRSRNLSLNSGDSDQPKSSAAVLPYLLLMLYPFVWYIVTASHSYVHAFFTHRSLCVTIFAYFCLLGTIYGSMNRGNESSAVKVKAEEAAFASSNTGGSKK
ncbi:MAG: hypothetical protein IJT16_14235 [Lachnospiraceae bacterium]|nr:hypothetical protein [Lachnospiraceae bacterium]